MVSRREALAALGSLAIPLQAADPSDYLLINQSEINAVREKAQRVDWARAILKQLMDRAETAQAKPISIPDRGGQWGHWFSCPKDGVPLVSDSPTRHRCPKCGAIYTGEPYDSVYITRLHAENAGAMLDMGLAFRFTGRPEFASKAAELLLGYARKYSSYPRHDPYGKDSVNAGRVMSQTLDESSWLISVTWAYTLVRGTLGNSDRRMIEHRLLLAAVDTIVGMSYAGLPNIQCWKDSAIGGVGFALGMNDLIAEALDHPVRGVRVLLSRDVMPGGLWWEGSLGYHNYALSALWTLMEAARHHGIDFYENDHYRSMFDAPLALALPDGSMPGFNDNPGEPLSGWAHVYELAYTRWKREKYGQVLSMAPRAGLTALLFGADTVPKGNPIATGSVILREAGYAVLRSPAADVAVRFGMHGSGHGHPDKPDIVTYAEGRHFGVDPGSIGYGVPLFFEWYKNTISHNTVTVDETRQSRADGKCLSWSATAEETALETEVEVYQGVTFRRALRLRGAVCDDRFTCESQAEHTYDWAFHSEGDLKTSLDLTPRKEPIAKATGYNHIQDVAECHTDGEWTAIWENEGARLTLHVKGVPGTTVFTGKGPGPIPGDLVDLILIRRRSTNAAFEVTHTFEKV